MERLSSAVFIQCFNVQTVAVARHETLNNCATYIHGVEIAVSHQGVIPPRYEYAAQIDLCRFRTRQYRSFISYFHTQRVK